MSKPVRINYTSVAEKELRKLSRETAQRILQKVLENTRQPDILARAKPLVGRFAGMYRYRVGDYRVVFVLDDVGNMIVLTILTIKHRKDVYRS